ARTLQYSEGTTASGFSMADLNSARLRRAPISLKSGPVRPPFVPTVWQAPHLWESNNAEPFAGSPVAFSAALTMFRPRRNVIICQASRPGIAKAIMGVPGTPPVIVRYIASSEPPFLNVPETRLGA